MDEVIIKKFLGILKRIEPSSEYMARSKAQISLRPQEEPKASLPARLRFRFLESLTLTGAIAMASLLLLITVGSLSYLHSIESGQTNSSFNNDALIGEAKNADFQMQLKDITYFDESSKQVAIALDKIAHPDAKTSEPQ